MKLLPISYQSNVSQNSKRVNKMQVQRIQNNNNITFEGCGGKNRMCKEAIKRITKMAEEKGISGKKLEGYIQEQLNRQQKTNFLHIYG